MGAPGDITVMRIEDVEPYRGPNALPRIEFRALGRELGITAWGMNVLKLAPGATKYPEHAHAEDGQEEVYVVLEGSATLQSDGEEWRLERGMVARVGPAAKRKWLPGESGVTILAVGATPGKAYVPRR